MEHVRLHAKKMHLLSRIQVAFLAACSNSDIVEAALTHSLHGVIPRFNSR